MTKETKILDIIKNMEVLDIIKNMEIFFKKIEAFIDDLEDDYDFAINGRLGCGYPYTLDYKHILECVIDDINYIKQIIEKKGKK